MTTTREVLDAVATAGGKRYYWFCPARRIVSPRTWADRSAAFRAAVRHERACPDEAWIVEVEPTPAGRYPHEAKVEASARASREAEREFKKAMRRARARRLARRARYTRAASSAAGSRASPAVPIGPAVQDDRGAAPAPEIGPHAGAAPPSSAGRDGGVPR